MSLIRLLALLLFLPSLALASPFVVSDPVDPTVTHCGVFMDATPKQTITVTVEGTNKICKHDLAGLSEGSHTVRMTVIANSPLWGVLESPQSSPLAFVKPSIPSAPATLQLTP